MIQRIQTILLALAILLLVGFCFSTIWLKSNDATGDDIVFKPSTIVYYNGSIDEKNLNNLTVTESSNWHIVALAVLSGVFAFISIISYKNRVRQMKLGFLNVIVLGILVALEYYHINEADKLMTHPLYGTYQYGFFLPIACIILVVVANYYIKKDEDLVRSADRIR